jgi:hypothetical protein
VNSLNLFTELSLTWLKNARSLKEVSDFLLKKNTYEKWEKSTMTVKKYLEPPYDSFGKSPQTSVYINSNTSIELDSTGFATLCLDFDRAHGLHVKFDGQSGIQYPSS